MSLTAAPPSLAEVDHATFDAGLINACRTTHAQMAQEFFNQKNGSIHVEHVRRWAPPWYLRTNVSTPYSLDDYRCHITAALSRILCEKGILTERALRERDIGMFVQHWAHVLLREGSFLHRKEHASDGAPYTTEVVLQRTRHALREIVTHPKRAFVVESPVHPLWNKRGYSDVSVRGTPIWVVEGTTAQKALARTLVGPDINKPETALCVGSDLAREAIPRLLAVDRAHVIELQSTARQEVRHMLSGHESFLNNEPLRRQTIEALIKIWTDMREEESTMLFTLHDELEGPDIYSGETSSIVHAYIEPLLYDIHAEADEIRRRFPIVTYLTLRAILEEDTQSFNRLLMLWHQLLPVVSDRTDRCEVAMVIIKTFLKETTPQEVLLQI